MAVKHRGKHLFAGDMTVTGETTIADTTVELKNFWNNAASDIVIQTGTTAVTQMKVKHVTGTVVNQIGVKGSVANAPVELAAEGTDTNIGVRITPKGTGTLEVTTGVWKPSAADLPLKTGATVQTGANVKYVASAVNYPALTPSVTTSPVELAAEGSDTDISVKIAPKGAGSMLVPAAIQHQAAADITVKTGTTTGIVSAVLKYVATAVNYLALTPSVTTAATEIAAAGTDTDIDIKLTPKGAGRVQIGAGISGAAPVVITDATPYAVLASNSGKLHVIPDMTQDTSITLPTEAAGLHYEFIYGGAAAESHDHTITSEADLNFFVGGLAFLDTNAGPGAAEALVVRADGNSNSKLTLNNVDCGTRVILWCDGTRWYVTGTVVSDTAPAFADQ